MPNADGVMCHMCGNMTLIHFRRFATNNTSKCRQRAHFWLFEPELTTLFIFNFLAILISKIAWNVRFNKTLVNLSQVQLS